MTGRFLLPFLFLSLVFAFACEKKNAPPKVDFGTAVKFSAHFEPVNKVVTVEIHLADGYHAYAPGEMVGRPISMTIDQKNGWKQVGPVEIPAGLEKKLGSLGKSQVLFGTFILKTSVNNGHGPIFGSIHIQICTEELCDRPRTHSFKVEFAGVDKK